MFCVGLTGNIGTGKSTVLNQFQQLGIETISADIIAKNLTNPGGLALQPIIGYFGPDILKNDQSLNRAALKKIIFNDPVKRQYLEQLLHPLIKAGILEAVQKIQSPYGVIEIPLLFQHSDYPYLDRIVLVMMRSLQEQIQRIIKRDNCLLEEAEKILAVQSAHPSRMHIANDIIYNDETIETLKAQILNLHQQYLIAAKIKLEDKPCAC